MTLHRTASDVHQAFDGAFQNIGGLLAEGAVIRSADRARAAAIRSQTARLREARLSRLEAAAVAAVDRRQAQEREDTARRLRILAAARRV